MRNILTMGALAVVAFSAMAGWIDQTASLTAKYCSGASTGSCAGAVNNYTRSKAQMERNSTNPTWAVRARAFETCLAEGKKDDALGDCAKSLEVNGKWMGK